MMRVCVSVFDQKLTHSLISQTVIVIGYLFLNNLRHILYGKRTPGPYMFLFWRREGTYKSLLMTKYTKRDKAKLKYINSFCPYSHAY